MTLASNYTARFTELNQELVNLLKGFRQAQLDSEQLKHTLTVSEQIIKLFRQFPEPTTGYIFLYKNALPYSSNLVINTALLTTLLCQRLQWNDTSTKQMVCAALTLFAHQQRTLEHFYLGKIDLQQAKSALHKMPVTLIAKLGADARQSWKSGLKIAGRLHLQTGEQQLRQLNRLDQCQQVLFVAAKLALAITPNKILKNQSWAHAVKAMCQTIPPACYSLIEPLLTYPGLYPPGSLVQTRKGSNYLVLGLEGQALVCQQINVEHPAEPICQTVQSTHIKKCYAPRRIASPEQMEQWWHQDWYQNSMVADRRVLPAKNTFRVDSPPDSLLAIQTLLQTPEPDTNKLTSLINAEPIFAEHIQHLASLHSRQHLPVTEVKHAIMMHGFDRTNSILIQQAMLVRLAQHKFPLQQRLIQFTQLAGQIAANITQGNKMLVPEQATSYIIFATSGLFTHALLKTCLKLPTIGSKSFDLSQLFNISKSELIKQHSVMLAKAWQQERVFVNGIQLHENWQQNISRPTQRLAALLGLSLTLARQGYFPLQTLSSEEQQYIEQSTQCLNVTQSEANHAMTQALFNNHSFTPLP